MVRGVGEVSLAQVSCIYAACWRAGVSQPSCTTGRIFLYIYIYIMDRTSSISCACIGFYVKPPTYSTKVAEKTTMETTEHVSCF